MCDFYDGAFCKNSYGKKRFYDDFQDQEGVEINQLKTG